MKHILLDNPAGVDRRFNLGDDIQVQAARRFLPDVDGYMTRAELARYRGTRARIILNGWFMHDPSFWPPSDDIDPLLVSFHMNPVPADEMLRSGRDFFERHAPVGCRDHQTLELFEQAEIDAYYSGCLTLTLERDRYLADPAAERAGVYAVDLLYKMNAPVGRKQRLLQSVGLAKDQARTRAKLEARVLDAVVPATMRGRVLFVEHSRPMEADSLVLRHAAAAEALGFYAKAELVVTSRIHCALPCLAFGTPVIFVDGALDHHSERARLNGIIELMPVLKVDPDGNMDLAALERDLAPASVARRSEKIAEIRSGLEQACRRFIEQE